MDLIGYIPQRFPGCHSWRRRLEAETPAARVVVLESPESLRTKLLRPKGDLLAVVLCPADEADLSSLLELREHLTEVCVIVVLPSWDLDLAMKVHSLCPRLVTSRHWAPAEVPAVLRKMAGHQEGSVKRSSCGRREPHSSGGRGSDDDSKGNSPFKRRGRRPC